ncbi:hypothetical protein BDQ94DRAFT_146367 [Aspergillus welwitschiae]|uniref:Uncharacterized protein n=1 Tax=Aspergillus welwitschiae TaxID=1341132 RepID=A0A3F3PXN2_9EURO|nr:hypothetical protein BDQ94DRAFT_146367 [Aspergillus welwitschiae]RDH31651.1 hypothetical protein BDQ94DRAFT_146367 [Aspergillus welwitschiae]
MSSSTSARRLRTTTRRTKTKRWAKDWKVKAKVNWMSAKVLPLFSTRRMRTTSAWALWTRYAMTMNCQRMKRPINKKLLESTRQPLRRQILKASRRPKRW